jgi:hypothetical protein
MGNPQHKLKQKQTSLKGIGELICFERVNSSCCTSGTRYVPFVTITAI